MKILILVLLTIVVLGIAVVIGRLFNKWVESIPFGYQDKTGFHYGHPSKDTEVDD